MAKGIFGSATALGVMAALLTGCTEPEVILPGKREAIRSTEELASVEVIKPSGENRSVAISLPSVVRNTSWTQSHASPATRVNNAAFSGALQPIWGVNIGAGDSKRGRIDADPVAGGGRIYTLDSEAQVTATSPSGATVWSRSLVPELDSGGDATGGGLAYADGTLFVTSGFGTVSALSAANGVILWQQKLLETGNGKPTVSNGKLYLVSGDRTAWALDVKTGRVLWQLSAPSDRNNIMGGAAPAVNDQMVLFSYGSNEVQAAFKEGGLRLWDAVIPGQRLGYSRSRISDVTGGPVIVGNTAYMGTHSGRMVALDVASGARKWTTEGGPMGEPWIAGGSAFLVTEGNKLARLDAQTGEYIWTVDLPFFVKDKPRRQKAVYAHHGPVLAGGRLYVASSDGFIRAFDPRDGRLVGQGELPGGAATAPIFAGGVMYVVTSKGQLYAFR